MAVQSEILTRTVTQTLQGTEVKFASGTGTLAMGIPGKIYDDSPRSIHTIALKEDAEVGSFVEGEGVIVNAPEYALQGSPTALSPSLVVKAGMIVSVMTMGHVMVKQSQVEAILAGMYGRVLDYPVDMFEDDDTSDTSEASEDSETDPLVVVEVTAVK